MATRTSIAAQAYLDLRAWQQQNKTFQQIAYYTVGGRGNFLEGNGGSLEVYLNQREPEFLPYFGR